ncbi:MAG: glycerate kinase [Myxococcales bacterium]|nr:glycerate kinase [Myxococcales bacterium]
MTAHDSRPLVLIAPQEFKGTLSAREAAEAIARGLRQSMPRVELDILPIADGGPGTVEAFLRAGSGEQRVTRVRDPLGRPVDAAWGLLDRGRTAVIEMAAASGLALLAEAERDLLRSDTTGTGELIRAALDAGCSQVLVGVGGSATTDGGAGAAKALGVCFLDASGSELAPNPESLRRLARIDTAGRDPRLGSAVLKVLTDVRNPLCGAEGAALVYGPQKGADPELATALDAVLERLAAIVRSQLGIDIEHAAGAGAGGGLAFGLAALCGGQLVSGFEAVSAALSLFVRVRKSSLVLTGEGRLDAQTAYFKGPFALARLARMQGKPVVLFAGSVAGAASAREAFDEVVAVTPPGLSPAEVKARASELLERAVAAWSARGIPLKANGA